MKKESIWDYPRPPLCTLFEGEVKIMMDDQVIAKTQAAYRVVETSLPPSFYIPAIDIKMFYLKPTTHRSFCEWKGPALYYDFVAGEGDNEKIIEKVAWTYHNPTATYRVLEGYLSFYAGKFSACFVNNEQVKAQESGFYGGWITSNIVLKSYKGVEEGL